MKPTINIDKMVSLCDEPICITASGLPPHTEVTIVAEMTDYFCINAQPDVGERSRWKATANFCTSAQGTINLEKDTSLAGSYIGKNAMGLLYLMKPEKVMPNDRGNTLQDIRVTKNYEITLSIVLHGKQLAEKKIKRNYQNDRITHHDVVGKNLVARFFEDENRKKKPAIIVLSGSDGRIEKAQTLAQLFSSHGYAALAVCYFGLEHTSQELSHIPLETIEAAIDFLCQQDGVDSNKIGIYGRSKGGELALLAGTKLKTLSCVVANTPSSFVMEGLTIKNRNSNSSSWMYRGEELPYIPFHMIDFVPYMLKRILFNKRELTSVYAKIIRRKQANASRIKVETIHGNVLLISAKHDEIWPSEFFCRLAIEKLQENSFPNKYAHKNYVHSGHHLTIGYEPNPRYPNENWEGTLKDSHDSWQETLHFFSEWAEQKA